MSAPDLRLALLLLVGGLSAIMHPREAMALAAPVGATQAAWQEACDSSSHLRVMTRTARFETSRLQLDSAGVRFGPRTGRAAFIVVGEVRAPERRIEWAEVERIDRAHGSSIGRGAVTGLLIGGVLSGMTYAATASAFTVNDRGTLLTFASAFTAVCVATGALFGALSTEWAPIAQ